MNKLIFYFQKNKGNFKNIIPQFIIYIYALQLTHHNGATNVCMYVCVYILCLTNILDPNHWKVYTTADQS